MGPALAFAILFTLICHAVCESFRGSTPSGGGRAGWQSDESLKILFIGNSLTYGPPPYDRADQSQLNNLPRLFKFVAESFGKRVIQEEDTIGGCSLYAHLPSRNPEACADTSICQAVDKLRFPRVNDSRRCTVLRDIQEFNETYHPCPQTLLRQPHGAWDVIVLNEHSFALPIEEVRRKYYYPAVQEYAQITKVLGPSSQGKKPLVALYMTSAYLNGQLSRLPSDVPNKQGCWPGGDVAQLAYLSPGDWHSKVHDFPCQTYAIAQGAASALGAGGGDVLVPAGLAWQVARGSPEPSRACVASVNEEYGGRPTLNVTLPLRARDPSNARWKDYKAAQRLYRDKGPDYVSTYCPGDCTVDQHPSAAGMYLNALVFYATLYKSSPIGAGVPQGEVVDGMALPTIGADEARALQHIAHDTVMGHLDAWWATDVGGAHDGEGDRFAGFI
uniref:SGNH hydrolase-type esterase domain-containing protein n=1 Tax=Zooxanthella nutricula TaxID=1333877 RepID=A0A6U6P815_9DINO|mmetsp:Transcript_56008/g.170483  ORF Transcript_56008/g.170483 Transcript_56008/m.170483 type:complete len:444 (+) Transcript_56008:137-1468(+)